MITKPVILLLLLFILISGCTTIPPFILDNTDPGAPELLYFAAPPVLYDTDRLVRTPGFWISRHPDPYTSILTPQQILVLNKEIKQTTGAVKDFSMYVPVQSGANLYQLLSDLNHLFTRGTYYSKNGQVVTRNYIQDILENENLKTIPEKIHVHFGLITAYTDQRLLPSAQPLFQTKGEWDFDALQNSALDIGEPVTILHFSLDREWAYIQGLRSGGWVRGDHIASCTREELLDFTRSKEFVVLISAKNELFYDKDRNWFIEYARMGARLPLAEDEEPPEIFVPVENNETPQTFSPVENNETSQRFPTVENYETPQISPLVENYETPQTFSPVENYETSQRFPTVENNKLPDNSHEAIYPVYIPTRDESGKLVKRKVYIGKENCSEGYLAYTPGNMIRQAFKLLNAPYGWGGMYGEQDCSQFLCEVFSTAGIILPRNSSRQAISGIILGDFTRDTPLEMKENILERRAVGGITLLYQQGHIMLYLGMYGNKPYAIHTLWAIAQNIKGIEVKRIVNRTVVSTLFLSETSAKGSYLKRLKKITLVSSTGTGTNE